jgi:FixJ family two-component response regulator
MGAMDSDNRHERKGLVPECRRPCVLKRLTPRHKHAAALVAAGIPNRQVSQKVGLSEWRVSRLRKDPLFAAEVTEVERELRARITEDVAQRLIAR